MRRENPYKTQRVNLEIDVDNLQWLKNRYPGISIWWLFNEFLSKFRGRHEPTKKTELESNIQSAAEEKAEYLLDGGRYD